MARATRVLNRRKDQRGAVLVEAAIGLLFLLLICGGILEYAGVFSRAIDTSAAVGSSVRTAATPFDGEPASDYQIIQSAIQKSGAQRDDIVRIVIYKAETEAEGPPSACISPGAVGSTSDCNIYGPGEIGLSESAFGAVAQEKSWLPAERELGIDYIGVWLEAEHKSLFNFVGAPEQVTDWSTLLMMPAGTASEGSEWGPAVAAPTPPPIDGPNCWEGRGCWTDGGGGGSGGGTGGTGGSG